MLFKQYENLRTFIRTAESSSFSAVAKQLNLTKGAVSQQIKNLESELGFKLFDRIPRGVALTRKGGELFEISKTAFGDIDRAISRLQQTGENFVTIAVSTYFASRWLSPRLMNFMKDHPDIKLKIFPMVDLQDIEDETVDLVIRWGNGKWQDIKTRRLFLCPSFPTGPKGSNAKISKEGFTGQTLLKDWKGSTAWEDWHRVAGMPFDKGSDSLIIPDPNVRVQAVMDGQGIALNDELVMDEIKASRLEKITEHVLEDYGYFLGYLPASEHNTAATIFAEWLLQESRG